MTGWLDMVIFMWWEGGFPQRVTVTMYIICRSVLVIDTATVFRSAKITVEYFMLIYYHFVQSDSSQVCIITIKVIVKLHISL